MPKRITDFPLKSTVSYTDAIPIIDLDNPAVPVTKRILVSTLLSDLYGTVNPFIASEDLSGTVSVQKVIAIQNIPVSSTIPTDGQYLSYNASDARWNPITLPVGFSAGGDLSGTLTSQNVNAIRSATTAINVSSATAPSIGQVLAATSSTTAIWQVVTPSNVRGFATSQTFTSSGSWTAPTGVTRATITGWGGGGGGGGGGKKNLGSDASSLGGGGGGGALMNTVVVTVVPATNYTVTIGTGGAGGVGGDYNASALPTSGSNGVNTTFGSLATFAGAGGGMKGQTSPIASDVLASGYGGLPSRYQPNAYLLNWFPISLSIIQSGGSCNQHSPYTVFPGGACMYGAPTVGVAGSTISGNFGGGGGGCDGDGSNNGSAGGDGGGNHGGSAPNNSGNGGGGGGGTSDTGGNNGGNGGAGGSGKLIVSWVY